MIEIDKNFNRVLSIILNIQKTYSKYLKQANKTNNQYN